MWRVEKVRREGERGEEEKIKEGEKIKEVTVLEGERNKGRKKQRKEIKER